MKYDTAYRLFYANGGNPAGTVVYRLRFHDYGVASDDGRITGVEHVSVTLKSDGDYPGFTVPVHALVEAKGGV